MSQNKKQRLIVHVDMDAFFAAVEQLDHPEYRGKPVVVGADPKGGKGRGVVATASYEARQFGIRSAMPISRAYRLCPNAIFLRGRHRRYHEVSQQIMAILRDFSPVIQQISIDEAFLDMTGSLGLYPDPVALGRQIKERIRTETGLTASLGIASNKFVAKVASDLEKPDGLTYCPPGQEKEFLAPLPIRRLWGVGEKTAQKLMQLGFRTIGDIAEVPQDKLVKLLGSWGLHLWKLANGIDHRPVSEQSIRKSISEETTFHEDVDDAERIEMTLFKIADRVSRTMRRKGWKGRTITLKIRYEDFETHTRSKSLSDYVNDAETLRTLGVQLFRKTWKGEKKIRLIGLGVSMLNTLGGEQLNLFGEATGYGDPRIDQLLEELKQKYGENAVDRATFLIPPKSSSK